jgi:hypothetical protein
LGVQDAAKRHSKASLQRYCIQIVVHLMDIIVFTDNFITNIYCYPIFRICRWIDNYSGMQSTQSLKVMIRMEMDHLTWIKYLALWTVYWNLWTRVSRSLKMKSTSLSRRLISPEIIEFKKNSCLRYSRKFWERCDTHIRYIKGRLHSGYHLLTDIINYDQVHQAKYKSNF